MLTKKDGKRMKETIRKWYEALGGSQTIISMTLLFCIAQILLILDATAYYGNIAEVNINGWIWLLISTAPYALFLIAFIFTMPPVVARVIVPITFSWILLFSVIASLVNRNFGIMLRGEALQIMAGSSWKEVCDFIAMYSSVKNCLLAIAFVVLLAMMVTLLAKLRYFKVRFIGKVFVAIFLLVPWVVWTSIFPPSEQADRCRMFKERTIWKYASFMFFEETYKSYKVTRASVRVANSPELPSSLRNKVSSEDNVLGVLVLGESATRNRWSLYGYDKKTNPYLDSRSSGLFIFSDVVSSAGSTTQSLRRILSNATEEAKDAKYFLPAILRRGGYAGCFVSNQDHWGQWDGADTLFFKDSDRKIWTSDYYKAQHMKGPRFDEVVLPYVGEYVASATKNMAIYVHLMGSHVDVKDKCPPLMAKFGLDEKGVLKEDATKSEHYDNSIAYTDYVLDEMLKMLEERGGASFLIYLSDHGESPSSEYWRYAPDKDLWEVPMFIWMSEEYKAKYPEIVEQVMKSVNKPLVSDQLLFGLTRLFLIEGLPDYKEEEDFLSDKFIPREKRYNEKVQGVK